MAQPDSYFVERRLDNQAQEIRGLHDEIRRLNRSKLKLYRRVELAEKMLASFINTFLTNQGEGYTTTLSYPELEERRDSWLASIEDE